jgi:hypothetical protein
MREWVKGAIYFFFVFSCFLFFHHSIHTPWLKVHIYITSSSTPGHRTRLCHKSTQHALYGLHTLSSHTDKPSPGLLLTHYYTTLRSPLTHRLSSIHPLLQSSHTLTHSHTHTRILAYMNTCTHAYTHTRIHAHTIPPTLTLSNTMESPAGSITSLQHNKHWHPLTPSIDISLSAVGQKKQKKKVTKMALSDFLSDPCTFQTFLSRYLHNTYFAPLAPRVPSEDWQSTWTLATQHSLLFYLSYISCVPDVRVQPLTYIVLNVATGSWADEMDDLPSAPAGMYISLAFSCTQLWYENLYHTFSSLTVDLFLIPVTFDSCHSR